MKIFGDTETTGLLRAETAPIAQQPYIIEICLIKTDDDCNVIDKYVTMIKPPMIFEEQNEKGKGITQITGISNAMLADKKPFSFHYREIADFFLGVKSFVAHNVTFDIGCIKYELMRIQRLLAFPWPIEHECTIEQSLHIEGYRLNLQKLHTTLFGEGFEGGHRAEADVEAMIRCYKKLHGKGEYASA